MLLLTSLCFLLAASCIQQTSSESECEITCDYVIVGAGTSGCVVASRLSENKDWTVCLIDAGYYSEPNAGVPVNSYDANVVVSLLDTYYSTELKCGGECLTDQRCRVIKGWAIGGSSASNFMLYIRGAREDFDEWECNGAEGWGWEDVKPYFLKAEDEKIPEYTKEKCCYGTGGPVSLTSPPFQSQVCDAFLQAGQELGYCVQDINCKNRTGFTRLQTTQVDGARQGIYEAYIQPVQGRPNLHIIPGALVTKVLLKTIHGKLTATWVEYSHGGKQCIAKARREIILAAGAIRTAQLLMLSGIGPKEELRKHGIKVHVNLPVGRNLYDQVGFHGMAFTLNQNVHVSNQGPSDDIVAASQYGCKQSGRFALPGYRECISFMHSRLVDDVFPDVSITVVPSPDLARAQFLSNCDSRIITEYCGDNKYLPLIFMVPVVHKPKSRGCVTLNGTDPQVPPVVDPGYLCDERDLDTLVEGMKLTVAISETEAMQAFGTQLLQNPFPNCENYSSIYDEQRFRCMAKCFPLPMRNYAGTCKMGCDDDPTAVVDTKLRVRHVARLRVVGAVVAPSPTSGIANINSIMMGEKLADMIKEGCEDDETPYCSKTESSSP